MPDVHAEILLIEDDPNDAALVLRELRRHHVSVGIRVARDGAEAVELLFGPSAAATRPSLILLDLKLPKIDGIEVLRALKADPRTSTIPVVVLTSSREIRDLGDCYRLGVNSYVVKPVEFEEFREVVRRLGVYWLLVNEPPLE